MKFSVSLDADAGLDAAWGAMIDIAGWPRWTTSITSLDRLDSGPLRVGSRARIKQPGFPVLVWEVTDLQDRSEFTWVTRSAGALTVGRHIVERLTDGKTRITLTLDQTGPIGAIVAALIAAKTRRYLNLEVAGLKAASEARSPQGAPEGSSAGPRRSRP